MIKHYITIFCSGFSIVFLLTGGLNSAIACISPPLRQFGSRWENASTWLIIVAWIGAAIFAAYGFFTW